MKVIALSEQTIYRIQNKIQELINSGEIDKVISLSLVETSGSVYIKGILIYESKIEKK